MTEISLMIGSFYLLRKRQNLSLVGDSKTDSRIIHNENIMMVRISGFGMADDMPRFARKYGRYSSLY